MTTFIHDGGQLQSYQIKLASDAKVIVDYTKESVTLFINDIVKEVIDLTTFTVTGFENYINNLRSYYGVL